MFLLGTLLSANADTLDLYNNFIFSANNNATQRWTIWKKNDTGIYAPLFNDIYNRTTVVVSQDKAEMIYVKYRPILGSQPPMWSSTLDSAWICRNNIAGTNERILLLVPDFKRDAIYDMDWSSDKTQILFTKGNDRYPNAMTRDGDVFLYNTTNSALTNLTNNWDLWERTAKFLKDNDYIYYGQCPNGWFGWPVDIHKKFLPTGSPSKITSATGYSNWDQEVFITGVMNDGSVIYRRNGNYKLYKKKDSNAEALLLNMRGCGGIEIGSDFFAATTFSDTIVLFKQSSVLKNFKISQISSFNRDHGYSYNHVSIVDLQWLGKLCAKTSSFFSIGNDIQKYCGIDSVKLTASAGFKSYLWNGKDTGKSIYIKQTKKVTLMGIDAIGCKVYDTAIISILNPHINPSDTIACLGTQVFLRSKKTMPSQLSPLKLTWSTSDTAATTNITAVSDTLIWIKASDGIGTCYDTSTVFVSKPQLNALNDTLKFKGCQRDSLRISVGSTWASCQWSDGIQDSSIYLKTTGKYKVTVKNQYGCSANDSTYFVNPGRVKITALLADSIKCFGGNDGALKSIYAGGFTPHNVLWNDPSKQITSKASSLKKGIYKVIVKDLYGCSDSITGTINEPAKVVISITNIDSAFCYGYSDGAIATSTKGGTGAYNWNWNTSPIQTTPKSIGLKKGNYKVIVKDVYGCSDSIMGTVNEPEQIVPKITMNRLTMLGMSHELYADITPVKKYQYLWTPLSTFNGLNTQPRPRVIFDISTRVGLQVTDYKGCKGYYDTATITVVQPIKNKIPTGFTPNADNLNEGFGLPDIFEIQSLEIYDRWGGLIFKGSATTPRWDGRLNGELVPAGVYAYTLQAQLKGTDQIVKHGGSITLIK